LICRFCSAVSARLVMCISIVVALCGKKVCKGLGFLVYVKFSKFVKKIVMIERSRAYIKMWSLRSTDKCQNCYIEHCDADLTLRILHLWIISSIHPKEKCDQCSWLKKLLVECYSIIAFCFSSVLSNGSWSEWFIG
jgi:hypothetical protein